MEQEKGKKQSRNKTILIATIISYIGNTIVIFGYFFPLEPVGALIYFAWFTLGWVLFWLRLPKVADIMLWVRLLRKWMQRLHKRFEPHEGQTAMFL